MTTNSITVRIPGAAADHLLELDSSEDRSIFAALERAERARHGKYCSFLTTMSPEVAREAATRFRDLADVERQTAEFGDGADQTIRRACDQAADRIEEALQ